MLETRVSRSGPTMVHSMKCLWLFPEHDQSYRNRVASLIEWPQRYFLEITTDADIAPFAAGEWRLGADGLFEAVPLSVLVANDPRLRLAVCCAESDAPRTFSANRHYGFSAIF